MAKTAKNKKKTSTLKIEIGFTILLALNAEKDLKIETKVIYMH